MPSNNGTLVGGNPANSAGPHISNKISETKAASQNSMLAPVFTTSSAGMPPSNSNNWNVPYQNNQRAFS
jgi:hypothetical protein